MTTDFSSLVSRERADNTRLVNALNGFFNALVANLPQGDTPDEQAAFQNLQEAIQETRDAWAAALLVEEGDELRLEAAQNAAINRLESAAGL